MFSIPLAWLQLRREPIRLLVALAGISFAVILMFIQLGFRDALFESAVRLHTSLQGDIFLISPQSTALVAMQNFSERRLYQALSVEGVESVSPLYLGLNLWKNPTNRSTRSVMVLGFDPEKPTFRAGVASDLRPIYLPDVVLFDQKSRPEFGSVEALLKSSKPVLTEVGGRRITVGGLATLGASFGADGNLFTSDSNFLRLFPQRRKGLIEIGIIQLKPGADLKTVQQELKLMLQDTHKDVKVLSRQQFIDLEKHYWQTSTAIGFIFTLGTVLGFIVGIVIVYQILYTDVADHLAEYATLKAMGYTNLYLLAVVFQEALMLSVLGFIPGFLLSNGLYTLTRNATSLPLSMTADRALTVFILTVIMCTISGAIAVRKVQDADPAEIF
ncbi:MAG: ABC transporter permease DevC [Leptolyngbyaceae cyanobacterium]